MAANPRIVTAERWIAWDGVSQRVPKGQVLDVPPGSALEREIGREYLVPLGAAAAQPPAEEAALAEEPEAPAAKPKGAAKKQDDGKDGDS